MLQVEKRAMSRLGCPGSGGFNAPLGAGRVQAVLWANSVPSKPGLSRAAVTSLFSRLAGSRQACAAAVPGLPRITGSMALDVPFSPSLLIGAGKLTLTFHVARDGRHRIMESQEAGTCHPGQPGTEGCIDDE
jgi:hypothetical protein